MILTPVLVASLSSLTQQEPRLWALRVLGDRLGMVGGGGCYRERSRHATSSELTGAKAVSPKVWGRNQKGSEDQLGSRPTNHKFNLPWYKMHNPKYSLLLFVIILKKCILLLKMSWYKLMFNHDLCPWIKARGVPVHIHTLPPHTQTRLCWNRDYTFLSAQVTSATFLIPEVGGGWRLQVKRHCLWEPAVALAWKLSCQSNEPHGAFIQRSASSPPGTFQISLMAGWTLYIALLNLRSHSMAWNVERTKGEILNIKGQKKQTA